jgi:hypothetical protein
MSSTFEGLYGQNMKGLLENNALCGLGFSRYADDRDYGFVVSDAVQFSKEMPTSRRNLNISIAGSTVVIIHQTT